MKAQHHLHRLSLSVPDPPSVGQQLARVETFRDVVCLVQDTHGLDAFDLERPYRLGRLPPADDVDRPAYRIRLDKVRGEGILEDLLVGHLMLNVYLASLRPCLGYRFQSIQVYGIASPCLSVHHIGRCTQVLADQWRQLLQRDSQLPQR